MAYALSQALKVDIESAAFKRDPFPTFARLRAAGAVIPMKLPFLGRCWVTTTHAACDVMLKDQTHFVQEGRHAGKRGFAGQQWWMPKTMRLLADNMLLKDEPDHRRLRSLVNQAFQRRGVQAMRGDIEALAVRLLDDMDEEAVVDFMPAFARRLPLEVICDLLGFDAADRDFFIGQTQSFSTASNALGVVAAIQAIGKLVAFLRAEIERRRTEPVPGLLTELVRAEADGATLSEDELLSMAFLLLVAGFETTTHLIAGGVIALAHHPAQKAYLMADPEARLERAVEELLRWVSPVQSTKPRFVAQDMEFFGQPLRRGETIIAFVASGDADPARFDEPEQLHLDRFPNPHLAFGTGIHFCLGMQLARVEAQCALKVLLARYPEYAAPAQNAVDYVERFGMRGARTLPIRLKPARRAAA